MGISSNWVLNIYDTMSKKKKCKCDSCGGKYYSQGELDESEAKLIKKLALRGVAIYRQYGKPGTPPCGGPGQLPCLE